MLFFFFLLLWLLFLLLLRLFPSTLPLLLLFLLFDITFQFLSSFLFFYKFGGSDALFHLFEGSFFTRFYEKVEAAFEESLGTQVDVVTEEAYWSVNHF